MNVIDLSIEIDKNTPVFPGDAPIEIKQRSSIEKDGVNVLSVNFHSHSGTHVDAPYHMLVNGKKLDDFPISHFIGEGVVIDVTDQLEINCDLKDVKPESFVFFYTNYLSKISEKSFSKINPQISLELAEQLIEKKVRFVGIDALTVDNAPFNVHKLLLSKDICIVENLTNLKSLIGRKFTCHVMPLKIKHADGAPARVIAILV